MIRYDINLNCSTHSEEGVMFNFQLQGHADELLTVTTQFNTPWAVNSAYEQRFIKTRQEIRDTILDVNCIYLLSLIVLFSTDSNELSQSTCKMAKENMQKMLYEYVKTIYTNEDEASEKTYLMISSITDIRFLANVLQDKRMLFWSGK